MNAHTQTSSPALRASRPGDAARHRAAVGGCSSLLEVDNPNNVSSDAFDVPTAATAIVNGAINTGAQAISSLLNAYNIISDEKLPDRVA